ncbi:alpha/beta hydrolase [Jeotgalibaca sp. MA1X17-3]|uniref:alpha/beta hydrolase n=1 Tax=Jeotgalibaca sp. MA1X17-3 TaxID=2908211 RepID=UPI001F4376A9|nr:alpha/beta hydrolase [Jeotgalibaca sp. MA1X17-3]UJF15611.1 alpha/beta hydrolase [Jeotgalibaca sp. MA1X17-3]
MKKKIALLSFGMAFVPLGVYFGLGNYFYNYALNAKEEKEFLQNNPHLDENKSIDPDIETKEKIADEQFIAQQIPKARFLTSTDKRQLRLHAEVYENEMNNSKWVVAVHGYGDQASKMTRWIRPFYEHGYNILAPDLRGHGKSEGDYIGMGWHDRLDLLDWVKTITNQNLDAEIVLFGVSMGAAAVMAASGEALPPQVKVIVEDCGYTSVSDVFSYQLADLFKLPNFPVMNAANSITKLRAGFDIYKASAVNQVKKSTTPMLFIHGDQDTFVPFEMLDQVYQAAQVEKEKVVIPGAEHADAVFVNPELYWESMWKFVDRYI